MNFNEGFHWDILRYPLTLNFKMTFEKTISTWDTGQRRFFLLHLLQRFPNAISLDEDVLFHNLCLLLSIFLMKDSDRLVRGVFESSENPMRDTNLVVLATRVSKKNSKFSSAAGQFLLRLARLCGAAAEPGDVDRDNCTAFYHAMKTSDVSFIRTVSERTWKDLSGRELDDHLSRAYRQLKLRNVALCPEIEAYVIGKLVDLRFYSTTDPKKKSGTDALKSIVARIHFLSKAIQRLMARDDDMELTVVGEYVAKSLHVLKYQLKSTYDSLPWEEMEFCLLLFLKKCKEPLETHMFYNLMLTTDKMSAYLGLFAEVLESRAEDIEQSSVSELSKYPVEDKAILVAKIKCEHRLFVDLYSDFERVRDFHSLQVMKTLADLVEEADWNSGGLIVVTRALQVIGEHLKTSKETPKLSTAEYLLEHFQEESRKLLEKLRDSLSKDKFLVLRERIADYGEPFFQMLKADVLELNLKITSALCWKHEEICGELVSEILQCRSPEEVRNLFNRIHLNMNLVVKYDEEERVRKIFQKSFSNLLEFWIEQRIEDEVLTKISLAVKCNMEKITRRLDIYYSQLACIKSIAFEGELLREEYLRDNLINLNLLREQLLKMEGSYLEYIEAIRSELKLIFKGVKRYVSVLEFSQMKNIKNPILYEMSMSPVRLRWIKEMKGTLDANKKIKRLDNSDLETLKASKLRALGRIFEENNMFERAKPYVDDPKLRAQMDMLFLDLMSLLSEAHFSHNPFFLDHVVPTAIGKNLRNHLAHGNTLYDVLLPNLPVQILSSARKILSIDAAPLRKIDEVLPCDVAELAGDFERDAELVDAQRRLLRAAGSGGVEECDGADVDGRDTRLRTPLHLAALGGHYQACRFY